MIIGIITPDGKAILSADRLVQEENNGHSTAHDQCKIYSHGKFLVALGGYYRSHATSFTSSATIAQVFNVNPEAKLSDLVEKSKEALKRDYASEICTLKNKEPTLFDRLTRTNQSISAVWVGIENGTPRLSGYELFASTSTPTSDQNGTFIILPPRDSSIATIAKSPEMSQLRETDPDRFIEYLFSIETRRGETVGLTILKMDHQGKFVSNQSDCPIEVGTTRPGREGLP